MLQHNAQQPARTRLVVSSANRDRSVQNTPAEREQPLTLPRICPNTRRFALKTAIRRENPYGLTEWADLSGEVGPDFLDWAFTAIYH